MQNKTDECRMNWTGGNQDSYCNGLVKKNDRCAERSHVLKHDMWISSALGAHAEHNVCLVALTTL